MKKKDKAAKASSMSKHFIAMNIVFALAFVELLGCGVKGDPLPPDIPAELGRGRPNYKRATEGIELRELPEDLDTEEDEENPEEEIF